MQESWVGVLTVGFALSLAAGLAFSVEEESLEIASESGKTVCASGKRYVGPSLTDVKLCVVSADVAKDAYAVHIGGKPALTGLDDDAAKGISSMYQGKRLTLSCVPQSKVPRQIPEERISAVRTIFPQLSSEEAREMAIAIETVEVGRRCTTTYGKNELLTVQILFR